MMHESIGLIAACVTIIAFVYGVMRNFKDAIIKEMREENKERKEENRKMDQRVVETNKRMDGVYHILLKRTENTGN